MVDVEGTAVVQLRSNQAVELGGQQVLGRRERVGKYVYDDCAPATGIAAQEGAGIAPGELPGGPLRDSEKFCGNGLLRRIDINEGKVQLAGRSPSDGHAGRAQHQRASLARTA